MIDRLQEQLRLALRRQFGPRNEYVNIDQIGLVAADAEADTSTVIELSEAAAETGDASANAPATQEPPERKKAVRILKDLPRESFASSIFPMPRNSVRAAATNAASNWAMCRRQSKS